MCTNYWRRGVLQSASVIGSLASAMILGVPIDISYAADDVFAVFKSGTVIPGAPIVPSEGSGRPLRNLRRNINLDQDDVANDHWPLLNAGSRRGAISMST